MKLHEFKTSPHSCNHQLINKKQNHMSNMIVTFFDLT